MEHQDLNLHPYSMLTLQKVALHARPQYLLQSYFEDSKEYYKYEDTQSRPYPGWLSCLEGCGFFPRLQVVISASGQVAFWEAAVIQVIVYLTWRESVLCLHDLTPALTQSQQLQAFGERTSH